MLLAKEITKSPHETESLDKRIGEAIRRQRLVLGLTQEKLANKLGLTFQQIQKYERGQNRVSASRLYEIAFALGVSVSYFYEEYSDKITDSPGEISALDPDLLNYRSREAADLLRVYFRIQDRKKRQRIFSVIKVMTDGD